MSTSLLPAPTPTRPKFGESDEFHLTLRQRVEEFFQRTGRRPRDCWQMYLKSAIILAVTGGAYISLVFFVQTWWQALPVAVLLGLGMGAIGFNIQHDGGHQAYSDRPWVNRIMATTMDLVGGSSYCWHWKHAVIHHTYTNITGHDTDIDLSIFGRLSPHQPRLGFHRWQHFYLWGLYGLITSKWHLYDDFRDVITGRMGGHRFPRPKGWDLAVFLGGRLLFFFLMFVLPLIFHKWWVVLLFYSVAVLVLGVFLSVVFQLAHCVEEAEFPLPQPESNRIEKSWAVHEIETTVDFARDSKVLCWLLGGLNFQVEHHLFPRVCHIHYPALSKIVEQTCREFGVRYTAHRTLWDGLVSHYRWLRRMGEASPA